MYSATNLPAFVTGQTLPTNSHACPNREAALLGLAHSDPKHLDRLFSLSVGEWRKVFRWLDVSGLTLYFANRVNELNLQGQLPPAVNQRLQQNLSDNRARIRGLLQESAELQADFRRAKISYAVLKGFSLCPSSVSMPELRHQLDLDFLVEEEGAPKARRILERAGYHLHEVSGRTWEFKKNPRPRFSPKNMFIDGFGRTVELHIQSVLPGRTPLLSRREYREIEGVMMPVLSPADLFVRQGMHVFKDVCSSFVRASHLLEFYRHVCARGDDPTFWSEVRAVAEEDPRAVVGLGVVLQLIESVMEGEIPSKLAMWTMLCVPPGAQRWVALYGKSCVYGTPPGTKLYLLLQRELENAGLSFGRSAKDALLPTRLPHTIIRAGANDTLAFGFLRQALQLRFILARLRFHVVEGLRYAWASYRWRRYRSEVSERWTFSGETEPGDFSTKQ